MKAAMPISNTNKKLKRRARCKSYSVAQLGENNTRLGGGRGQPR
jgi:hypothetical protein